MRYARTLALLGFALAPAACYTLPDLGDAPFKCTYDYADCPDSYACDGAHCVRYSGTGMGGLAIKVSVPKTGSAVSPHLPFDFPSGSAPDQLAEPNDNLTHATPIDSQSLSLAIYPMRDIDVFHGDAQGRYMRAALDYDFGRGDLDVALLDERGAILASDGSTTSTGCVVSAAPVGSVYFAVVGAHGKDEGRYTVRMETNAAPLSCPAR